MRTTNIEIFTLCKEPPGIRSGDNAPTTRLALAPSAFALVSSLVLVALVIWSKEVRAQGIDRLASEQGMAPCTVHYQQGALLFPPGMAQKLVTAPQDLKPYIKSISNRRYWGLADNLALKSSDQPEHPFFLELKIPRGAINPGNKTAPRGGAGYHWTPALPKDPDAACLTYAVWFPADFDFVKGGKLPGIFGGTGPSGGKKVTGSNGFSTRFMWRTDGAGEVYAYIIGNDRRGISLDRGAFAFKRGGWTNLVQEVILNTPGQKNGTVRVWADGQLVISRAGLSYRSIGEVVISGVMAHVFFGGKDPSWASSKDTVVRMTPFDLRWQRGSQSVSPAEAQQGGQAKAGTLDDRQKSGDK